MPIWHNESRPPERAGFSLHRAGGRLRGIFSFHGKRISPFDPQEKGIRIASEQLEELQCLPIALPIARRSRVGLCYTTWLAPTIRCRSAHLIEVRSNLRLPNQCGERSNAAFGKQSAAEQTSHAPHDSKARLQHATKRRGSWRSHVHCTRFRRLSSFSRSRLPMSGVEGPSPCVLLGDLKGAILSRERMAPFAAPCAAQGIPLLPSGSKNL